MRAAGASVAQPRSRHASLCPTHVQLQAYAAVTGAAPPLLLVHAGLEVSNTLAKLPGIDAVAIGPLLE